MEASGTRAYLRNNGALRLYRSARALQATAFEREVAAKLDVPFRELDEESLNELEPSLCCRDARAILWPQHASVSDPYAVTRGYLEHLQALGGRLLRADARRLTEADGSWRIENQDTVCWAPEVVVALGPWSGEVLAGLDVRVPMVVKRGYHMHYRLQGPTAIGRPVTDTLHGYVLAPMAAGVRLTTGVELARRTARATPVQLEVAARYAAKLLPLGAAVDAEPWLGARPCFPDLRPAIGKVPGRRGLWLCTGHAHSGFGLGPVTGRLLAELMCGETPICDPIPFSVGRF
jgi:D-amino-acid dehydrogenase